jgi:hypothetical protein
VPEELKIKPVGYFVITPVMKFKKISTTESDQLKETLRYEY